MQVHKESKIHKLDFAIKYLKQLTITNTTTIFNYKPKEKDQRSSRIGNPVTKLITGSSTTKQDKTG